MPVSAGSANSLSSSTQSLPESRTWRKPGYRNEEWPRRRRLGPLPPKPPSVAAERNPVLVDQTIAHDAAPDLIHSCFDAEPRLVSDFADDAMATQTKAGLSQ
ncbi:hypothetical protein EV128_111104 [Rhizobium azibense]|nr:hypothetical protein EV128_111104 [Rhizobium azibense]